VTLRLFETVTADSATRQFFKYLSLVHWMAAVAIVVFGDFTALALSALVLTAVSGCINRWHRYRRSPFALVASVSTCVYFVLPAVFIAISGDGYQFGEGLASVPRDVADYAHSAPLAIAYLAVLLLTLAASLALSAGRREPKASTLLRNLRPDMPIGVLAIVVLVLAQLSNDALLLIRATGSSTVESLWGFIFFDHAYLMLLPVVVSLRLLRRGSTRQLIINWQFALILILFLLQATIGSTSKGFILTLFVLSFVMPLSYLQSSRTVLCLMPSRLTIAVGLIGSVWVYFLAQALRVAIFTGGSLSVGTILGAAFSSEAQGSLGSMLAVIGYRVATSLDRYILLFDTHLYGGHSGTYALQFAEYLGKNFLNLVLPGTPFPEAYAPSSNLMPAVLSSGLLMGDSSKAQLLLSLNTQPYTLFGVAIVLCGAFAPIAVFAAGAVLGLMYRLIHNVPVRLALIYLFNAAVHSYGIEVVLANAIHLGLSMFLFVWMMRSWRRVRIWIRALKVFGTAGTPGVPVQR
jgi:hypothetical protein